MSDEHFLAAVRAAIGARDIPKRTLARRCGVSRPYFSEMLHGDRVMPAAVRDRLIRELGIATIMERLTADGQIDTGTLNG